MRKNYAIYYRILDDIANAKTPPESDYDVFLQLSKRQLFFVARDLIIVLDRAFTTMFSGVFLHKIAVPKEICYLLVDALTFNYSTREDFEKILACSSPIMLSYILENRYIPIDMILSEALKEKLGEEKCMGELDTIMNVVLKKRRTEIIEYARKNLLNNSVDFSMLNDEMILKISGYSLHKVA
jgi:hypothetical protein